MKKTVAILLVLLLCLTACLSFATADVGGGIMTLSDTDDDNGGGSDNTGGGSGNTGGDSDNIDGDNTGGNNKPDPTPCPHTSVKNVGEKEVSGSYKYVVVDSKTHRREGKLQIKWQCQDCKTEWWADPMDESVESAHEFNSENKCVDCGYEKSNGDTSATTSPTSTATAEPSPTPKKKPGTGSGTATLEPTLEPTATPLPSETFAPLEPLATPEPVAKGDEMVRTLLRVFDEAEHGLTTSGAQIVGAKEILSKDEYARLRLLSSQEQLLVTLEAAGMGDSVDAAMAELDVTLSDDAQALMASIRSRMDAMTPQEQADFEGTLAVYFPVETKAVDGAESPYRVIRVEIRTFVGVKETRAYGFCYVEDDAQWVFVQLDVVA